MTMIKNDAYISNDLQLKNHSLTLLHKNKSLPSATCILSRSPMAYNTTASMDKPTCTDYVDFGICHDRFGRFPRSKKRSSYLDAELKVFMRDDNRDFRLVQNHTMGDADIMQFS